MSVLPQEQDIYPENGSCFAFMRHSNGWWNSLNRPASTAAQQQLSSAKPHPHYCHAVDFPDGLRIQVFNSVTYCSLTLVLPLWRKSLAGDTEGIHLYFTNRRSTFSSSDPLVALTEAGDLPISCWLCFTGMTKQHILPEPMNLRPGLISRAPGYMH